MSADNGFIIRINDAGYYVAQMYFASSEYPSIEEATLRFTSLEGAVDYANDQYTEYGLTIDLSNEKKEKKQMETQKFSRKSFPVEAVQVTRDNMEEVATWCKGKIEHTPTGAPFIRVDVHMPQSEKQTKAFVKDWVLFAGRGFKVFTDGAFQKNFDPIAGGDSVTSNAVPMDPDKGTHIVYNVFNPVANEEVAAEIKASIKEYEEAGVVHSNAFTDLEELRTVDVPVDPKDQIAGSH